MKFQLQRVWLQRAPGYNEQISLHQNARCKRDSVYSEVDQEFSSYHQVMKSKMNTIALIGVKHLIAKVDRKLYYLRQK